MTERVHPNPCPWWKNEGLDCLYPHCECGMSADERAASTTTAEPSPSPDSSRPVSTVREEDEQGGLGASKARRAEEILCVTCGHSESDHSSVGDLRGCFGSRPMCRCLRFKTPLKCSGCGHDAHSPGYCPMIGCGGCTSPASTSSADALPENTPLAAERRAVAAETALEKLGVLIDRQFFQVEDDSVLEWAAKCRALNEAQEIVRAALAAEEKVEARETGLGSGGLQSRPSGGGS